MISNDTTIRVDLLLTGDFNPDTFTALIQLSPTSTHRQGDNIGRSIRKYKYDVWLLSIEETETIFTSKLLDKLFDNISGKIDLISEVTSNQSIDVEISVVIYIKKSNTPEIHFSKEIIKQISKLNASIDIDIVSVSCE